MKKLVSTLLACMMVMTISAPQAFAAEKPQNINQAGQTEAFFDDFSGNALDTGKWLVAEKMWGGWNGGVVPENVSVSSARSPTERTPLCPCCSALRSWTVMRARSSLVSKGFVI